MISEYIRATMKNAKYKKLDDDTWFADIPGFQGVWANSDSVEKCREELAEVLEEWLMLKISHNEQVPVVDGITVKIRKVA